MSINNASLFGADISFLIITVLLSVAVAIVAVVLLAKFNSKVTRRTSTFLIILAVGLFARIVFAFFVRGDREDMLPILNLFNVIASEGTFTEYLTGSALSPLAFLIYYVFGAFANLFSLLDSFLGVQIIAKLPLIIADMFSAFIIYKIARKYSSDAVALILSGIVCVMPVFVIASSAYTSIVSLCLPFALGGIYFLLSKSYVGVAAFFGAAALVCKEGVFLLPIPIVFMGYNFIKAIIALSKRTDSESIWKHNDYRAVIVVPLCFVGTLVASYIVSLVQMSALSFNPWTWFVFTYIRPLTDIGLYTDNALSIFTVFMRVGADFTSDIGSVFVAIYALIIFAITIAVYLFKRNRAVLVVTASYIVLTLGMYFLNIGEFTQLLALALLLGGYLAIKDKRVLYVFFVMCVLVTLNSSLSFMSSGYLSSLEDSVFSTGAYTGSRFFTGAIAIVSVITSVLGVLTHFYFTYLILDISVSNNIRQLKVNQDYNFTSALKAFVKKD